MHHICRCLAIAVAFMALSCGSGDIGHYDPKHFKSHEEAGSFHVAVASVRHWDEFVAEEIQPEFELDEKEAITRAVTTGLVEERSTLDLLKATLAIAYQNLPKPGEGETDPQNPEPQDPTLPTLAELQRTSTLLEQFKGDKTNLPSDTDVDSMTLYRSAASLFQEVKLLNRVVKDAATREGYRPLVVRLNVALQPNARHAPYDAYVTLGFFPGPPGNPNNFSNEVRNVNALIRQPVFDAAQRAPHEEHLREALESIGVNATGLSAEDAKRQLLRKRVNAATAVHSPRENQTADDLQNEQKVLAVDTSVLIAATPIVVPILVTDGIEQMVGLRTTQKIQQFGLSLSALFTSLGIGGDFQKSLAQLISSYGQDVNSLLSVARLSDNSLRIRLGASLESSAKLAMMPATRAISVLVLVPEALVEGDTVRVASEVRFVDASTGKELPIRNESEWWHAASELFESSPLLCHIKERADQFELFGTIEANDFARFVSCMQKHDQKARDMNDYFEKAPPSAFAESAWIRLGQIKVGADHARTSFAIPREVKALAKATIPTRVIALDNGKETVVVASGYSMLEAGRLRCRLLIKEVPGGQPTVSIWATKFEVQGGGTGYRASFPSLDTMTFPGKPNTKMSLGVDREWTMEVQLEEGKSGSPVSTQSVAYSRVLPATAETTGLAVDLLKLEDVKVVDAKSSGTANVELIVTLTEQESGLINIRFDGMEGSKPGFAKLDRDKIVFMNPSDRKAIPVPGDLSHGSMASISFTSPQKKFLISLTFSVHAETTAIGFEISLAGRTKTERPIVTLKHPPMPKRDEAPATMPTGTNGSPTTRKNTEGEDN